MEEERVMRCMGKVKRYYTEDASIVSKTKERQKEVESRLKEIDESAEDIPSLTTDESDSYRKESILPKCSLTNVPSHDSIRTEILEQLFFLY